MHALIDISLSTNFPYTPVYFAIQDGEGGHCAGARRGRVGRYLSCPGGCSAPLRQILWGPERCLHEVPNRAKRSSQVSSGRKRSDQVWFGLLQKGEGELQLAVYGALDLSGLQQPDLRLLPKDSESLRRLHGG